MTDGSGRGFWGRTVQSLGAVFGRTRLEREMDEEIAFHIASRAEDLQREGLSEKDAMRQARLEFGHAAGHKHAMRVSLGWQPLDDLLQDLRYAARLLVKHRGFTAVTVLSLALAIGANTAIFSLANEVLFARLHVPHAEQLRSLHTLSDEHVIPSGGMNSNQEVVNGRTEANVFSYPAFLALQRAGGKLSQPFGYQGAYGVTLSRAGAARQIHAELVSGNYFTQMNVGTALGRTIAPSDDHIDRGAPLVAVLSYSAWRQFFGGSDAVLGRVIRLNGYAATIVGVAQRGFTGAEDAELPPALFLPLTAMIEMQPGVFGPDSMLQSPKGWWVKIMARTRGADAGASAELTTRLQNSLRATVTIAKGNTLPAVVVRDGSHGLQFMKRFIGQPVYAMLGMGSLVLLLACVNVANLMLARARARARELSVRLALGAGRSRLFRQMLAECLLLCAMGGALGTVLAYLTRQALPAMLMPIFDGPEPTIPFDWHVLGYMAVITLASAVVSGLVPAWHAARSQPGAVLKESAGAMTRRRRFWSSKALVCVQVSLSLVLLVASALFLRTLNNLGTVATGFDPHGLLLFDLSLPPVRYPAPKNTETFLRMVDAMRGLPGVQDASFGFPLLSGSSMDENFHLEKPSPANLHPTSTPSFTAGDARYLRTLRIPLLAGHGFTDGAMHGSQQQAIVNEMLARTYFGQQNPIGRRFRFNDTSPWIEIVGVCGDTLYDNLHEARQPLHFDLYTTQSDVGTAEVMVRTALPPAVMWPTLRALVARFDPDIPLNDPRTQDEQIQRQLQQERLLASLSLGFGVLAVLLSCIGIYGVLSYSVAERTREIGIRLALGASLAATRRQVVVEALGLTAVGVVAGLGLVALGAAAVRSLLFGVKAADPVSLASAVGCLVCVAGVAAWVPARRASRVSPVEALRAD